MLVDRAQYLAFAPDKVPPLRNELFQVLRNPYKPTLAILARLGKPQPQRRLAIEQAGHVFEFKADEFRASAHGLIAHEL